MEYKNKWVKLIKKYGIKPARALNGALYAWLYRNDKNWLLATNKSFHQKFIPHGTKVDWSSRDLKYVRHHPAPECLIWDLDSPRHSTKWWIKQISQASTIEKNLDMLPITTLFLRKYSEDIGTYQIRRLTKVLLK
jgi:hypothetical protein